MSDSKKEHLQLAVLSQLDKLGKGQTLSTDDLPDVLASVPGQELTGALKGLEANGLVTMDSTVKNFPELNALGESVLESGSPPMRVLQAVVADQEKDQKDRNTKKQLNALVKGGFGAAMKLKWIAIDKETGAIVSLVSDDGLEDGEASALKAFIAGADTWKQLDGKEFETKKKKDPQAKALKKYVQWAKRTVWAVGRGPHFSTGM
jgi:hypothetical protein